VGVWPKLIIIIEKFSFAHNTPSLFGMNEYKFMGGSIFYNLLGTAKERSITAR